jgi:hypothetical protein
MDERVAVADAPFRGSMKPWIGGMDTPPALSVMRS